MAAPITNVSIRQDGPSKINVRFEYEAVAESFDTVMVLLVEQDDQGDNWILKHRPTQIWTQDGWRDSVELDFYNASYNKWWDEGSSAGSQDDTGNRRRIRRMPNPLGANPFSFGIMYYADQPDENRTSTIPGLEFYAVVGIVATVAGRPVVQLGDIAYSNQLAGA